MSEKILKKGNSYLLQALLFPAYFEMLARISAYYAEVDVEADKKVFILPDRTKTLERLIREKDEEISSIKGEKLAQIEDEAEASLEA